MRLQETTSQSVTKAITNIAIGLIHAAWAVTLVVRPTASAALTWRAAQLDSR